MKITVDGSIARIRFEYQRDVAQIEIDRDIDAVVRFIDRKAEMLDRGVVTRGDTGTSMEFIVRPFAGVTLVAPEIHAPAPPVAPENP